MRAKGSGNRDYKDAIEIQNRMAGQVIAQDMQPPKFDLVCGFDASYSPNTAYCSAAVIRAGHDSAGSILLETVETASIKIPIAAPYVPGLFMLREGPAAIQTVRRLRSGFDAVMIDGHGILHPRKCGLACYVGLCLDKPTVGVAKSLLCGNVRQDRFIEYHGEVLGYALETGRKGKMLYISVGNRISLPTAISVVKKFTRPDQEIPEPLLVADANSKQARLKAAASKEKSGVRA